MGFPAQELEAPSDRELGADSTFSPFCGVLAPLFCLIQYKPLFLCVCVLQHIVYLDTEYTRTAHTHIP